MAKPCLTQQKQLCEARTTRAPSPHQLTVGSLFAGIGGLELGLERCGMDVRWQVEIDPWCRQVLAKHWPNVERHDDVKTWPKADTERVDVICGGFPCQDISTAGKGAGLSGERSGLFFELMRVVREMEPRFILLENVSALLVRGMDSVLGELAQVGFDAIWHCVTAASVGAPHRRDRIFIIGYRPSSLADTVSERGRGGETRGQDAENAWQPSTSPWDGWWDIEPDVGRVAHGIPRRVDRLRGLGNAVVPQVAEFVGEILLDIHRGQIPALHSGSAGGTVSPLRGA
jgi:DNA (cytosine-5)-methyltransferase 1